jgi:hypothetical protein
MCRLAEVVRRAGHAAGVTARAPQPERPLVERDRLVQLAHRPRDLAEVVARHRDAGVVAQALAQRQDLAIARGRGRRVRAHRHRLDVERPRERQRVAGGTRGRQAGLGQPPLGRLVALVVGEDRRRSQPVRARGRGEIVAAGAQRTLHPPAALRHVARLPQAGEVHGEMHRPGRRDAHEDIERRAHVVELTLPADK